MVLCIYGGPKRPSHMKIVLVLVIIKILEKLSFFGPTDQFWDLQMIHVIDSFSTQSEVKTRWILGMHI